MALNIHSRYCVRAGLFLVLCVPAASGALQTAGSSKADDRTTHKYSEAIAPWLVSSDQGLAIIGAALESRRPIDSSADCSNLVHAIYQRAGLPYDYANSSELYRGTKEFRQVKHPQPGDLVVWRGHVGIVISPVQHSFFSAMRSGRGVEFYDSPYWQRRGQPRFFRYLKSAIPTSSASVRNANLHATGSGNGESSDLVTGDENYAPTSGISRARADRTKPVETSKITPPAVSSPVDRSQGATSHDSGNLTIADSQNTATATRHNASRQEGVWEKTATKPSAGIPFASEAAPAQVHAPQSRQGFAAGASNRADVVPRMAHRRMSRCLNPVRWR
jgi:NlpC/P60 family